MLTLPSGTDLLLKIDIKRGSNHLFPPEKMAVLAMLVKMMIETMNAHQRDYMIIDILKHQLGKQAGVRQVRVKKKDRGKGRRQIV